VERWSKESIIYKQFEDVDCFYIVLTGQVDLYSFKNDGYKNAVYHDTDRVATVDSGEKI
jgi:hypothetical protein